jgi:hypothetical protein
MTIGGCPPSDKITGYGAIWQRCNIHSGEFVTVAGTKDISFPSATVASIDTTSGDGPAYSTAIPDAIADWNSVDIDADWKLDQWNELQMMHEDRTITRWRLVITQVPTEPYIEFCAFLTDISDDYPLRDLATNTITLQPTGDKTRGELNPA